MSRHPDDPARALAAVYDDSAEAYDALPVHREPSPPFAVLRERFAALVAAGAVLDAGCGNGRDLPFFADRGLAAVGLDLSPGLLAVARRRFAGQLVQGDLRALPFADAGFQGAWACASLLHLPKADLPQALSEIHRVLVPQGVLGLAVKAGTGERWEANRYGAGERFFAYYQGLELEQALSRAAFEPLEATPATIEQTDWWLALARRLD